MIASLVSAHGAIQNSQQTQSSDLIKSNDLNSAAVRLFNEGKYDEALPLETEALELRVRVLGPDSAELIPLLTNLGQIHKRGSLEQSAAYFNRALKLAEKAYGPKDIRLASILDPLALVEYALKHTTTSEDLFVKSLKIKQASLSPQDPEIAETAYNLGQVYGSHNAYDSAAQMYRRAINIWEHSGEKDLPKLQKALAGYVLVLTALGKKDEASKAQHRLAQLSNQEAILNGGVLNGKALALIRPPYPRLSGPFHPSGTVQVRVRIDENGNVIDAKALKSSLPMEFDRAAESAARQSRFSPTFVDGKPVKVIGIIIYNFAGR